MAEPEVLGKETPKEQNALVDTGSRMSDILGAQARAHVQAHYLIAQNNRRDMDTVRALLLKECDRPRFAAKAVKRKPGIAEPMFTIRFAEAVQRAMGNLEPTRMIVFESPTQRIVRLGLSDLETNNHPTRDLVIEKTVERKSLNGRKELSHRMNSSGEVVYLVEATEDEMFTKESAWGSKWERQLTFKHLPADIADECFERCLDTQRKVDQKDPDAAKKEVVDCFFSIGVGAEQLKEYLGMENLDILSKPGDKDQPNRHLEDLRQIYWAIRDGDTNWREVMEARNETRGTKPATGETQPSSTTTSSAAGKAKAAAAAKAAKAGAKQEPSAANPQQETVTTQSTVQPISDGQQVGTQTKTQTSQVGTSAPVTENQDADPAGDLFAQQTETKPGPVAVEKQKAQTPPPVDESGW